MWWWGLTSFRGSGEQASCRWCLGLLLLAACCCVLSLCACVCGRGDEVGCGCVCDRCVAGEHAGRKRGGGSRKGEGRDICLKAKRREGGRCR